MLVVLKKSLDIERVSKAYLNVLKEPRRIKAKKNVSTTATAYR
jgi:hypothetical protein